MNKCKIICFVLLQLLLTYVLFRIFLCTDAAETIAKHIGVSSLLGGLSAYCLFFPNMTTNMMNQGPINLFILKKWHVIFFGLFAGTASLALLIATIWLFGIRDVSIRLAEILL